MNFLWLNLPFSISFDIKVTPAGKIEKWKDASLNILFSLR